ncbi:MULTISPECIES: hypothetical protein [Streptomycetaceae]|uniref:hypothetical protein n=1 Tax=Streptomycetaceae TaxID=2062 RepID=UPI00116132AC|nr:hypothetical protein [Streptomyces sp. CB02056]
MPGLRERSGKDAPLLFGDGAHGAGAWERQQPARIARELAAHGYGLLDAEGGWWRELDDGGRVAPLRRVAEGQAGR